MNIQMHDCVPQEFLHSPFFFLSGITISSFYLYDLSYYSFSSTPVTKPANAAIFAFFKNSRFLAC